MLRARIAGWLPALLFFLLSAPLLAAPSQAAPLPAQAGYAHLVFQAQPTSPAAGTAQAAILSPLPGQALQGAFPVDVFTAIDGFQSAELSFAFHDQEVKTWFLIAESAAPLSSGLLATWDTTTITDGVYDLQLVVHQQDGSQQAVVVEAVRVRNYTPVETDTPTPVPTLRPGETLTATPAPSATITPIQPTFTPLPPNPARLSTGEWAASLGKGGLAAGSAFALIGAYAVAKKLRKRS